MQRFTSLIVTGALLCGTVVAQTAAKPRPKPAATAKPAATQPATESAPSEAKLPDEATVKAFYERMFGFQQNVVFKVAEIKWSPAPGVAEVTSVVSTPEGQQIAKMFITADGKHAISGDMVPFGADPYGGNREMLKQAFGPVRGSATPSVTIVEFADLQCPACKAAQPIMDKLLSEVPGARLVFQSFPLEQLHPWAREAASFLDCIARNDNQGALTFMEAVYTHQSEITKDNATDKLKNYANMAKADPARTAACAASPETQARIQKSIELGKKLQITGTPTLFINGRPINNVGGVPAEVLKALTEFEATQK